MSAAAEPRPGPGRPSTGARERILAATIEVLKTDGYAGLTVAKAADGAGESKALIAYHFGSKQGLVAAAGRAIAEAITLRILAGIERAETVEAVIRGVVEGVEEIVDADPGLARVYFDLASVSVVEPEVRATIGEINVQWRGVVVALLTGAREGLPEHRARVTTTLLLAAVQGLALERIERGKLGELTEARELLVRSIVELGPGSPLEDQVEADADAGP